MGKERQRKKLHILFSILAAIALWLFVALMENPAITLWARGVEVDIVGTDTLAERGLVMVEATAPTVDVKLTGTRQGFYEKEDDDVTAQIDVSKIREAGTYTLNVKSDVSIRGASVTETSPEKIDVVIEPLVSVSKKVSVPTTGTCCEGFSVFATTVEDVRLTGPKSIVNSLSVVAEAVSVEGATQNVTKEVKLYTVNGSGRTVSRQDCTLSRSVVEATCVIQYETLVPVTVVSTGTPAPNMEYVLTKDTDEIMIFGSRSLLSSIKEIKTEPVDITGITEETTAVVRPVLPDGTALSEDVKITVTIRPVVSPENSSVPPSSAPAETEEN